MASVGHRSPAGKGSPEGAFGSSSRRAGRVSDGLRRAGCAAGSVVATGHLASASGSLRQRRGRDPTLFHHSTPASPGVPTPWAWNQAARQCHSTSIATVLLRCRLFRSPFSGSKHETQMDFESVFGIPRLRILLGLQGQKRFRPLGNAALHTGPARPRHGAQSPNHGTTPSPRAGGSAPAELRVVAYNVCGFGAGFGDVEEAMVTEVPRQLLRLLLAFAATARKADRCRCRSTASSARHSKANRSKAQQREVKRGAAAESRGPGQAEGRHPLPQRGAEVASARRAPARARARFSGSVLR